MIDDDWHRQVSELFGRALEWPEGEAREQALAAAAGDDRALLDEVRTLLAAHAQAEGFLESPPHAEAQALIGWQLTQALVGRRIGAWRIERPLHAGGMGAVYLARREGGEFEQQAALKVIRREVAWEGQLERFAQERQLLARLEHPNIARLLDGGTTEDGLPWLVMEYVDGQPIDRWADEQSLGLPARLALFERVCEAVGYAHRHLVVHRDLKPGNILVTPDGTPKLLDFGIAKLLRSDQAPDVTVTQHRALTPGYASPEQFSGAAVTTASDVYSLGVLLYRLLTGRLPLDLSDSPSLLEVERRITRERLPLPSEVVMDRLPAGLPRVGTLGQASLQRALRGDLDTIVMMALRREPERRFESAAALAEDLRRYRKGLPVRARADTLGYRSRKFARRHWKGLAALGGTFMALVTGLAVALWQADVARTERDRAQRISTFLQDILSEADPYESGEAPTVREVLRKADGMIAERFSGDPELEAALRHTVGYAQLSLMATDDAERNLGHAHRIYHDLHGPDDARSLRSRLYLGWLAFERGDLPAAEMIYREVIARLAPGHPRDLRASAFNDFGIVLMNSERDAEALELFARALVEQDPGADDIANTYNNIGHAHHNLGDLDAAEQHYRHAVQQLRALHPDGRHPELAIAANNLGVLLYDRGRPEEALALYTESLDIRRATLGEHHPRTGMAHLNLGKLLLELDRLEDARSHLRSALALARERLGEEHLQTLNARAAVARLAFLEGDAAVAVSELEAVRAALARIQAPAFYDDGVSAWLAEARSAR